METQFGIRQVGNLVISEHAAGLDLVPAEIGVANFNFLCVADLATGVSICRRFGLALQLPIYQITQLPNFY